jgi:hypothetical protein
MQLQTPVIVGLFAGLLLGFAAAFGDFGEFCIVALFGVIGVVVAKVLQGDIDVIDLVERTRASTDRSPNR